jgi:hypothetical protein
LISHRRLEKQPTVDEFLNDILLWVGREGQKSERYLQNVLNAYYLVGLIPYVLYARRGTKRLYSTFITTDDLQEVRRFCLTCFSKRLSKQDNFWHITPSIGPFRVQELSCVLNISLEDAKRRVRILHNLAALRKKGQFYLLSQMGKEFSSNYESSGEYHIVQTGQQTLKESMDSGDDNTEFFGFVDW